MASVAEQLRQAREARRLSIQQVVDITKFRTDHVRALEEGNYGVFSAPVYIRGFVRTYSSLLKLDVPQVMAALDAELGQTRKFAEPPSLTDRPRGVLDFFMLQLSRLDWRKTALGLAILAVLGGVFAGTAVWRQYRRSDPLKHLKPAVYQPKARHAGETLPLPAPPTKH